jgi:HEAT repeat protein
MAFYDLSKTEREDLTGMMHGQILTEVTAGRDKYILQYFSDEDTYMRKNAYLSFGKIYITYPGLEKKLLAILNTMAAHPDEKVRQTAVNAAGEIGKYNFGIIEHFMETRLFDEHYTVRNAVIGSIKKMGQKNPKPVLAFAKRFLHHKDKEVRREICHGIELRGRTHPQDILPLLKELQNDKTSRVRKTLVHVLGQIAYKKGCLETVLKELKSWRNKELVKDALEEIIDVHERYKSFAVKTQEEARACIENSPLGPLLSASKEDQSVPKANP